MKPSQSKRWGMVGTRLSSWAVAAAALSPVTARAQVEIGPRLGAYVPVGALIREPDFDPGGGFEKRQISAAFLGVVATAWVFRRLALEVNLAASPSGVAVTDSAAVSDKVATVFLASTRVLIALSKERTFYVGVGMGLVARSGSVWSYANGATAPAGVLAVGTRATLTPSVRMRFEIEDYVSRAQFDQGLPSETRARAHHDVLVSLGVVVSVNGR